MKIIAWCLLPALALAGRVADAAPAFAEVNASLGTPLWQDDSLWDDDAPAAAGRLQLPPESETKASSSFRAYPPEGAKLFGARPYTIALYGEGGCPTQLSVVFANKGDFGNLSQIEDLLVNATGAQRTNLRREQTNALRELPKAIEADAALIRGELTALFGAPATATYGQGRQMTEKGERWDWAGHAFLLTVKDDQFVALRLLPPAALDQKAGAQAEAVHFPDRVERRPNGDVVITNIPMVDQGPKGYCVPATLERMLRYAGIPADMYVIAMAAGTATGGGTNVESAISAAFDAARSRGHQLKETNSSLRITNLSRVLDQGEPILWTLNVNDELDRRVTDRSKQRASMTDPALWKKILKSAGKPGRIKTDSNSGHVCMIIGYNADTDEIAISDSWGPEFKERWITVDEAEAISQRQMYVIE